MLLEDQGQTFPIHHLQEGVFRAHQRLLDKGLDFDIEVQTARTVFEVHECHSEASFFQHVTQALACVLVIGVRVGQFGKRSVGLAVAFALLGFHACAEAGLAEGHVAQGRGVLVCGVQLEDGVKFGQRLVEHFLFEQDVGLTVGFVEVGVFDRLVHRTLGFREGQIHADCLKFGVPRFGVVPRVQRGFAHVVRHGLVKGGDVLTQNDLSGALQSDHRIDVGGLLHHRGVVEVGCLGHHACFFHFGTALHKGFGTVASGECTKEDQREKAEGKSAE